MCQARQYSDQMICERCGYIWDTNDIDPPTCKTQSEIGNEFLSEALASVSNSPNTKSTNIIGTNNITTPKT